MLSVVMTFMIAASCADMFDPIDPSGPPFSIFGYLDPSADTQWIRVSALRTVLRASAGPTGIAVTLEELGSGRIIELRDSTIRFPTVLELDSVYAHTFWTTQPIEPGASYRFRALGVNGAVAEAIVQIPRDYDLEVWVRPSLGGFRYIRVEGLKQVAFVFWNTYYYDGCYTSRFSRKIQQIAPGGDSVARMISRPEYGRELPVCDLSGFTITRQDVELVGSDAPWPHGQDYSTWRLVPDSAASNVTGALGFLGGVFTKTTRSEDCTLPGPITPDTYCKLRYDSTTATLRGTLASAWMKGIPVPVWRATASFTTQLTRADGTSYGADTRIEFRTPHFYAFVGHGYSRTRYQSAQAQFASWYGEPVQSYHPPHDRRHQVNAVTSVDALGFEVSVRWQLGSGLAFTRPLGFDEAFDYRLDLYDPSKSYGFPRVLLDRPFNARLPMVHRLDLAIRRGFDLSIGRLEVQIGAINAYDRRNMFYYDLYTARRVDQLPLAPFVSLTLRHQ